MIITILNQWWNESADHAYVTMKTLILDEEEGRRESQDSKRGGEREGYDGEG